MITDGFMKRFRLNRARNIIIYISAIILIISSLIVIDPILQKASFVFLIYGIFLWLLATIAYDLRKSINRKNRKLIRVSQLILAIIGFLIAFKKAFGFNLSLVN